MRVEFPLLPLFSVILPLPVFKCVSRAHLIACAIVAFTSESDFTVSEDRQGRLFTSNIQPENSLWKILFLPQT